MLGLNGAKRTIYYISLWVLTAPAGPSTHLHELVIPQDARSLSIVLRQFCEYDGPRGHIHSYRECFRGEQEFNEPTAE